MRAGGNERLLSLHKLQNYPRASTDSRPNKRDGGRKRSTNKGWSRSGFSFEEMEDAGNYRDRFAAGNCLNVFLGNCVVSPPRKNKEEQRRITGEVEREEGGSKTQRMWRAEEIAKKKKTRRRTKEWMRGVGTAREPANCWPSSSERGAFRPGVPSLRTDPSSLSFSLSFLSSCPSSPSPVSPRSFMRIMKAGILPPIVFDDIQRRLFLMKPK